MKNKNLEYLEIINEYPLLYKPLTAYMYENEKDPVWKSFIEIDKSFYDESSDKIIEKIDTLLTNTKSFSIKYLLLSLKMFALLNTDEKRADEIYNELKSHTDNVSHTIRKRINDSLNTYISLKNDRENITELRLWSERYYNDYSFIYKMQINDGLEISKNGNCKEGAKLFLELYYKGIKSHEPSMAILNLFNYCICLEKLKDPSLKKYLQLYLYLLGYYMEYFDDAFTPIPLVFKMQKENNFIEIFETANIINMAYEKKLLELDNEKYINLIKDSQNYLINYRTDTYQNNEELKKFLSDKIKYKKEAGHVDLSEHETITGDMLRKIIKKYEYVPDIDDPEEIATEYIRLKIRESYEITLDKMKVIDPERRKMLIISTFMSVFDKSQAITRNIMKIVHDAQNNLEEFGRYMSNCDYTRQFTNYCFSTIYPLYEGRRELIIIFLETMKEKDMDRFIEKYVELSEAERKMINKFVINYVVYDTKINMKLSYEAEAIKEFTKKYGLTNLPAFLSYYSFETKNKREKLEEVLKKFL